MALQRFVEDVLWDSYSAAAGEESNVVDVEQAEHFGVFVRTDTAIDLDVLVNVNGTYRVLTTQSIAANTDTFITWTVYPWGKTKFRVSAACTITLVTYRKT